MSKIITPPAAVALPETFDFGFFAGLMQYLPLGDGQACNIAKMKYIEVGPATDPEKAEKGETSLFVFLDGEDDPFELTMAEAFRMQNNLIALHQAAAQMTGRGGGRIHTV